MGSRFSRHHRARHGARPGDAARLSGIDLVFAVAGGSMGGMQVLQWAASYPAARVRSAADRRIHTTFGAEHRLPRGRQAGGDGRTRSGAAAAIFPRAPIRGAGSRSRAWARTSPICPMRRCTESLAAVFRTVKASTSSFDADFQVDIPTFGTRASPLSSASTPIPISISPPAPWTISISPPITWRPARHRSRFRRG